MSPEDELTEALAANAIGAVWNNPMMRLSAISQAAANFAKVADVAHQTSLHFIEVAAKNPTRDEPRTMALRYTVVRETCFDNIIELLKQIKNEPTP